MTVPVPCRRELSSRGRRIPDQHDGAPGASIRALCHTAPEGWGTVRTAQHGLARAPRPQLSARGNPVADDPGSSSTAATAGYVLTVTYGDTAAAESAAARVRAVHVHVRGTDAVTGLPYRAEDPELLLWVHAGMVDSIVHVVQRYGRSLDASDADRYVADMARFAEIIGVPAARIPASFAALREYLESVELRQATPAASDAIAKVLDPPGLDRDTRELWHDLGQVAVGTLPAWARSMYGFAEPPPELMEREPVRQLIGALDFAFESFPGVLEARERIELRMRE